MQYSNSGMDYPNMEFPYKYTKNGQKALLDKYLKNETASNNNFNDNSTINNQNTNLNNNQTPNQNLENNQNYNNQNGGNNGLLGALSSMLLGNNQNGNVSTMDAGNKNRLDITKLLPLLVNKNLKSSDLINLLAPMLGNPNLPLKDLFNNSKPNKENEELPKKEPVLSAGYRKVE